MSLRMWPSSLAGIIVAVVAGQGPEAPQRLDTTQPTCLALEGPDADALYLVPRTICDSRICKLRLELRIVNAEGPSPEPEVLSEGELTAGEALWNPTVRAKVEAALGRFRLPCRNAPANGALSAGPRGYKLASRQGSWWAVSDNGREVPLSRLGAGKIEPSVVDWHPQWRRWAFARGWDHEGNVEIYKIPLVRLAAPSLAEMIATPRAPGDDVICVGLDRDQPAMLVKTCPSGRGATGACSDERLGWVSARGTAEAGRSDAPLEALDHGCTDARLDEPIFGGRALMIGPTMSEGAIELMVFEPREQRWNLGPLRKIKTSAGQEREMIASILWNPELPYMVLRLSTLSGAGERFVWVDLAARKLAPKMSQGSR